MIIYPYKGRICWSKYLVLFLAGWTKTYLNNVYSTNKFVINADLTNMCKNADFTNTVCLKMQTWHICLKLQNEHKCV